MKHFFRAHAHSWQLADSFHIPKEMAHGRIRCRIIYDAHQFSIHYYPYHSRDIGSLTLVEKPAHYNYSYKYADRRIIEQLFELREDADDILIHDHGWIKDTSIANIAFRKASRWYTPSLPLLAGTTWKRLVSAGILVPRPIHQRELRTFDSFKLFNALNSFEEAPEVSVRNIR